MVTDRARIQSYFADTEEKAIQAYADKHRLTLSKAVEALVQKGLKDGGETPERLVFDTIYDQRIDGLDDKVNRMQETFRCACEKVEKLEYQICCLQEEMETLRKELGKKPVIGLTDDEISAMTGARIATVWEWRHGLRKPRGRRITEILKSVAVVDGRWIKQG